MGTAHMCSFLFAVVVVIDTLPPQQWLSVVYKPVEPFDSQSRGSELPSVGPTSMTLVGNATSGLGLLQFACSVRQVCNHFCIWHQSSSESPEPSGSGRPFTFPCQAAGSSRGPHQQAVPTISPYTYLHVHISPQCLGVLSDDLDASWGQMHPDSHRPRTQVSPRW